MAHRRTRHRPKRRGDARPERSQPSELRAIGLRIREARISAELTQEAAATRAGIDYKRWQALERGNVNPTARTLVRVAEAVNLDIWRLMGKKPGQA